MPAGTTTTSTMQTSSSPRNKKMAGPPPTSGIAQAQQKRPSLRYSLNHLGKALADVVGKDNKSSAHIRSASAIPPSIADRSGSSSPSTRPSTQLGIRRPSVVGAFERPSLESKVPQVRMRTMSAVGRGLPSQLKAAVTSSPKRASPSKPPPTTTTNPPVTLARRPSFMIKGSLAAPSTTSLANAPVAVGTTKVAIRPKMSAPPRVTTDDERPMEVKERKTDSPRAPPVTAVRTRERVDSRASPVRLGPTPKGGRVSPSRNDQTPTAPKDDREKRRERREKEKQAAEEKKEAIEREKKAALERERAKVEAKKAEERTPSGHRTSGSTATLTSASSIFTSMSRGSTSDSHTSGGSTKLSKPRPKSNTAVFPRAAQTVVLTPPEDEEEDQDTAIQTPMTRSRTATGSTQFGDVSSPAISRTLLASLSNQTESPIMAPLDQRLRHAGSFTSLNSSLPSSTLPSPVHPGTVTFPPPAPGLVRRPKDDTSDDEDWKEEGDVSALLETVISPLKEQATPAMPRFTSKSKPSGRSHLPETPSRPGGLPGRDALSYPSPAISASVQRSRSDKPAKSGQHRGPRESILSYDALVERSRLEEGDLEDMLRAPPPAVGLISPDMRPARNLPRLTSIGPKRMNLGGMSDSEGEIEEEPEESTVHVSSNAGQSISQVLFPVPGPPSSSPSRSRRDLAEKEKVWSAREEAWGKQQSEWEIERAQWEAERAHWKTQQAQWNAQRALWNAQQSEWTDKQSAWETERSGWTTREHQLESTVRARQVDIEALEQENGAHRAEMGQRSEEHRLEIEALLERLQGFERQSRELQAARERQAKYEAHARCTGAVNAWTGVCASLRNDAASCAADRAALKVILSGLEAMVRCE
ncbi:unnamed protein product [Rhizoctonia solani]|uniref:Uncharacterized protein n=1 Tax=Rhizoctonia solani TaxID=456999 RepID=A0A8H3H7G2_9AGAM|nr:unnamed protein product [Rhizoctonia solani]